MRLHQPPGLSARTYLSDLFHCLRCNAEIKAEYKACPFCGESVSDFVRRYAKEPIDGKYRIVSRLGAGGMGEVFKAEHVHLHTTRVIKLMRPNLSAETNAQERFLREARLATRIQHPTVATLHDFSTLPDGSFYMVWEFIEGKNLTEVMRRDGSFSPRRAATLAVQILYGLEAVHRAGIIHRDISPDNIMLTMDEEGLEHAKIIDLGIAKGGDEVASSQTQTGIFIGKLRYCSPEHLGLLPDGEKMDGRADLYSFAIVLYEMLAGAPPFAEETPQQYMISQAKKAPRPLQAVNPTIESAPALEAVIFKALEKDRRNRFASAREFARALEEVIPSLSVDPLMGNKTLFVPIPNATLPAHAVTAVTGTQADRTMYVQEATAPRTAPKTMHPPRVPDPPMMQAPPTGATATAKRGGGFGIMLGLLAALVLLGAAAAVGYFVLTRDTKKEVLANQTTTAPATSPADIAPLTTTQPVIPGPAPGTDLTVQTTPAAATDTSSTTTTTATATAAVTATQPATATTVATRPKTVPRPVLPIPQPPPPTETTATQVAEASPSETVTPNPQRPSGFRGLLRRPGKAFVESAEYKSGLQRGIIPDYKALVQSSSVQWSYVAPGVKLSEYSVKVGRFRNLTSVRSDGMMSFLENGMQSEINDVTNGNRGAINADGAVYWAESGKGKRGVGIEMVFRDTSGRIVAMLRHRIFENSPEDAAEEMPGAVAEFVEDGR